MVLGFSTQADLGSRKKAPTYFPEKIRSNPDYVIADLIGGERPTLRPKLHTLRTDEKDRWHAGRSIQFVTGNRTKNRQTFAEGICTGTQQVHMAITGNLVWSKEAKPEPCHIKILIDGQELPEGLKTEFALNDGFDTFTDFGLWFYPFLLAAPGRLLTLKLIHWTAKRYWYVGGDNHQFFHGYFNG